MKPLSLGIIGLGRAGYSMHLRELQGKEDKFRIAAACDCEEERRGWMEQRFGCKTYARVEDIVRDPDVDVIDIATRSCDHFKHAKTALDAGKIVFLEKPMCTNYEDAKRLLDYAEKDGQRRLFIRHNRRFEPKFMQVQEIIASGILGDVYYVRRAVDGYERRCDWQTLCQYGGGQLLNWGPHLVDQAIQLCGGEYTDLHSHIRQIAAAGDCEDYVHATFTGANGRIVEIEISGGTAMQVPEYVIYGTRGTLLDKGDTYELRHIPADHVLEPVEASPFTPEGARFGPSPVVPFETQELPWNNGPLDHTWGYLYDAVVNGADYPIRSAEALKVMQAITAIKNNGR